MAKYSIENSTLTAIADAIREKMGTTTLYTPAQMASVISAIQTGGTTPDFSLAMDFGTFVPSRDVDGSSTRITTGLYEVWVAFIWCPILNLSTVAESKNLILSGHYNADPYGYIADTEYNKISCCTYINSMNGDVTSRQQNLAEIVDNSFIIYDSAYYLGGYSYHWVAWGIPDEW